jgi:putative peptidoglycan binding protein
MKTFLLTFAIAGAVTAATPPATKPAPKSKHPASKAAKGKAKPKSGSAALAGVTGPRNHQAAPTPERYKEIQQALVSKGYLKGEPNGVWDADSTDAMRRFQTDNKLDPSGKLNSRSLIGLGLGPQTPQTPVPSVPSPAPQ